MNNINGIREEAEKWMMLLSGKEKKAIFEYTLEKENSLYDRINNHLRGIKEDSEVDYYIKLIDLALSKFNLKDDIEVYRAEATGFNIVGEKYNEEEISIEDIIETYKYVENFKIYKNYISTSICKNIALDYINNYLSKRYPNKFYLFIEGILKSNSSCGYIKSLSNFQSEEELLIMRNKKFLISEVSKFSNEVIKLKGNFVELEESI